MKKGLLGILAVGIMSTAANAGTLSMRFAGGATEITMAGASDTATIEVLFAHTVLDKAAHKVTGIDARFDVGTLVPGVGGSYIEDGSTKFTVTSISTPIVGWNTAATTLGPFNRAGFFGSAGDPAGLIGPVGNGTNRTPVVLYSFTIHKNAFVAGDTYIAFRQEPPLPAVYNGTVQWVNNFGSATNTAAQQFETGAGNGGDADPRFAPYGGFESLQPLIIHNVPEPSALALLALGGFAAMRRRK